MLEAFGFSKLPLRHLILQIIIFRKTHTKSKLCQEKHYNFNVWTQQRTKNSFFFYACPVKDFFSWWFVSTEALTVLVSVTLPGRWSVMDERWTPEGPLINEPLVNENRTPASHQRDQGQTAIVWTSSSQHWLTLCFTGASSFITL